MKHELPQLTQELREYILFSCVQSIHLISLPSLKPLQGDGLVWQVLFSRTQQGWLTVRFFSCFLHLGL